jgi:hypothetical protein
VFSPVLPARIAWFEVLPTAHPPAAVAVVPLTVEVPPEAAPLPLVAADPPPLTAVNAYALLDAINDVAVIVAIASVATIANCFTFIGKNVTTTCIYIYFCRFLH